MDNPIIRKLTSNCDREDCAVADHGSTTTLLSVTPTYDKNGNQIYRDPNVTVSHYRCLTCGKDWRVRSQDGAQVVDAA